MNYKTNLQNNFRIMYENLNTAIEEYLTHGYCNGDLAEVEAFLVATIHALMDYAERFLKDDESILACRYVNNTAKHADGFVTHKEIAGGMSFPIQFPIEFQKIRVIWKNNAELECRYADQKEAYKNFFAGNKIIDTLNPIAKMIEDGIETK